MRVTRDRIIEHMAHAMMIYDAAAEEKTWRELATAAYYAYMNCKYGDALDAPELLNMR